MTLTGHLMELRRTRHHLRDRPRPSRGSLALHLLPAPARRSCSTPTASRTRRTARFYVQAPLDGLSLRVKLATFGGLILASPIVLWEFWRFITPGLKPNEKRYAIPFIISTITLFLAGCALAYFSYAHALKFLHHDRRPVAELHHQPEPVPEPDAPADGHVRDRVHLPGAARLLGARRRRRARPSCSGGGGRRCIIITVLAAVFTPTGDPLSMLLLMIPLIAFYFASIGVGKLLGR